MPEYRWTAFLTGWFRRLDGSYNLVSLDNTDTSPVLAVTGVQDKLQRVLAHYPVVAKDGVLQQRVEIELFTHLGDDRPGAMDKAIAKMCAILAKKKREEAEKNINGSAPSQARPDQTKPSPEEGGTN